MIYLRCKQVSSDFSSEDLLRGLIRGMAVPTVRGVDLGSKRFGVPCLVFGVVGLGTQAALCSS